MFHRTRLHSARLAAVLLAVLPVALTAPAAPRAARRSPKF